jgi:hypothetical protein
MLELWVNKMAILHQVYPLQDKDQLDHQEDMTRVKSQKEMVLVINQFQHKLRVRFLNKIMVLQMQEDMVVVKVEVLSKLEEGLEI